MKLLRLLGIALFCLAAIGPLLATAQAGPNANGSLIVALSEGTVFTTDVESYCGSMTAQTCAGAVTSVDGPDPVVLNVIAAFPQSANPRVAGVTFGVTYNDGEVFLLGFGSCGDFELTTDGWPLPGEGTAVTFGSAQTGHLVEVYWFAAYEYYGNPNSFAVIAHPTQGANFADDAVPSNIDPIAGLGAFGFNTPGVLPCPQDVALGACCDPATGACVVLSADDCALQGGEYLGDGTVCDPNPCPVPPTGACCIGQDCVLLTQADCEGQNGVYQGDGTDCSGDPCNITPTIDSTWGRVKADYR